MKKTPIINEWLLTSQSIHNIDSQSGKLNECNQNSDYFSQEVCVRKRGQTFVLLGILRPIFYCKKWLIEMWLVVYSGICMTGPWVSESFELGVARPPLEDNFSKQKKGLPNSNLEVLFK